MDDVGTLTIRPGFENHERATLAAIYWGAFSGKLGKIFDDARGQAFLGAVMDPDFALVARDADATVLGLAGFKTQEGALVGGGWNALARRFGHLGTVWRAPVLAMLEREIAPGRLLMDGICVAPAARGRGVGTLLLRAVKKEAIARGLTSVRLDVIDSNPRAKALYVREGFVEGRTEKTGLLSVVFGFSNATEMVWTANT